MNFIKVYFTLKKHIIYLSSSLLKAKLFFNLLDYTYIKLMQLTHGAILFIITSVALVTKFNVCTNLYQ